VFSFRALLLLHGYALLTAYVFIGAAGSPTPVDPMLLVMGALIGNHEYSFWPALAGALAACLAGDLLWFELGRRRGRSILRLLCKLSLEPDSCVRNTEDTFARRGPLALLFVKFIPGLGLVSVALAGVTRLPLRTFIALDAAGSAIWISAYLILGMIFHHQVDDVIIWLGLVGQRAGLVVVLLLSAYLLFKYAQRRMYLRWLRINRISPHEVYDLMTAGCPVVILDLRVPAEVERSGIKISGAKVIAPKEIQQRVSEIPASQEIILYCT
jgi:membrane protein DedA with SNARE-associated domain